MRIVRNIARSIVAILTILGIAFITIAVYAMYTSNSEIIDAIHCYTSSSNDLGFHACMIMTH